MVVAGPALGHAVAVGDWPLAMRAVRVLERADALLPDARFLLAADAFRARDWRAAAAQVDAIERDRLFAFTVPVLRAWIALGSGRGDPLAPLAVAQGEMAEVYVAEHRALIRLATGRAGADELDGLIAGAGPRAMRVRIAAAATLARRDRAAALALLDGNAGPIRAARALVEARRPVSGAILTPQEGMAELLLRLAVDLNAPELTSVAATFARIATWLAPGNGEAWIVAADYAGRQDRHADAVAMLAYVRAGDPYAEAAFDRRVRMLIDGNEKDEALRQAEGAVAAGGSSADQLRLGEVLMSMDRPAEAAAAFGRAISLAGDGPQAYPEWALWLMRGGAHDQADEWPEARAALERAYTLAPDQPLVLNYLGYAQLARRENLIEAERLIREAHARAPDNAAITDSLGWALFLKGEHDEGIALLERAVEGEPADVEINEHLGDAYFTVGRRAEARFAWRAARVYAEGADAARLDAKLAGGMTPELAAR
ncbi:MAG: tetratricopeptide repeat protein [Sphingomonas sp.]|nr:tetratricopeptide repeat protein [Sphingomonas sp.]